MSGILLCKWRIYHLSAASVWVSASRDVDTIPVHSLPIAVTYLQVDVRQSEKQCFYSSCFSKQNSFE